MREFILAYKTLEGDIGFIKKDYLIEVMDRAEIGLDLYDDERGSFVEDLVPSIGRKLLVHIGEPNGTFFYSLIEEVWDILREKFNKTESWRLPSINELRAMYDIEGNSKLKGFLDSYYWSSTSSASGTSYAWYVNFSNGYTNYYNKSNSFYVRCVREGKNNTLELAPSATKIMTYLESKEYAKDIKDIKQEDIITLKLDGLVYKELRTTKKYNVRVELKVNSIDLVNVAVEATSKEEAKKLAIIEWSAHPQDYDPWESEGRESEVGLDQIDDWILEEIK